jgi:hypothetical protein
LGTQPKIVGWKSAEREKFGWKFGWAGAFSAGMVGWLGWMLQPTIPADTF